MKRDMKALNLQLKENKYSNLFIIDSNTNEFCLKFTFIETDLTIEILNLKMEKKAKI
jgi:3-dehydroquinate synthase